MSTEFQNILLVSKIQTSVAMWTGVWFTSIALCKYKQMMTWESQATSQKKGWGRALDAKYSKSRAGFSTDFSISFSDPSKDIVGTLI